MLESPIREAGASFARAYAAALQRAVDGAAVPYGFTVVNAAAGGVLIRVHGPPTMLSALLFLCAAVAGFGAAALIGRSIPCAGSVAPLDGPRLGVCSGAAALAAFACAAPVAQLAAPLAFGAVGLTVTSMYLGAGALAAGALTRREEQRCR